MATLEEFLKEWTSPRDYVVAHTSGSTGTPKEIRLPKADMRMSARATNTFFGLDSNSRAALPLSPDYIAGKMMAVRALEGNYPLDILPVSNDIQLPVNTCYSLIPVVPSQLPSLLNHPEYTARIENVLIGGAQPDAEICRQMADAGYRCFISYGMTETCSHVALCDATDSSRTYKAMPGISFSTDSENCLIIEAPHFSFRRLMTKDIVELIDATSFRWRGRYDNAINTGGLKLLPEELEKLYSPFLPGLNFYVTGRPHEKWGQCICLVVEGNPDTLEISDRLRVNIDHKKCPLKIESVDRLPRTENGKIKRI